MDWLQALVDKVGGLNLYGETPEALIDACLKQVKGACHIVVMSNGGFAGIHAKLVSALVALKGETKGENHAV